MAFTEQELDALVDEVYEKELLVLPHASWDMYDQVLHSPDLFRLRISYDCGQLEIMIRYSENEGDCWLLNSMTTIMTMELKKPIAGCGHLTLRRKDKDCGLDPDACFWFRYEKAMRRNKEYTLPKDPPPELVFEVEVVKGELDRLGILASLNVREVWKWNGAELECLLLTAGGDYIEHETSQVYRGFRPSELAPFIAPARKDGSVEMLTALRQWIREQAGLGVLEVQ